MINFYRFFLETLRTVLMIGILALLATEARGECLRVLHEMRDGNVSAAMGKAIAIEAVKGTRYTLCSFRSVSEIRGEMISYRARTHLMVPPAHKYIGSTWQNVSIANKNGRISMASAMPNYCNGKDDFSQNVRNMKRVL